jgi:hypothetical protein
MRPIRQTQLLRFDGNAACFLSSHSPQTAFGVRYFSSCHLVSAISGSLPPSHVHAKGQHNRVSYLHGFEGS